MANAPWYSSSEKNRAAFVTLDGAARSFAGNSITALPALFVRSGFATALSNHSSDPLRRPTSPGKNFPTRHLCDNYFYNGLFLSRSSGRLALQQPFD
ncbi:hypothetical protein LMG33810_001302 [Carnimonas sp. LMG 33810]